MRAILYFAILLVAAFLEAGGDALVRRGLGGSNRLLYFGAGGLVLFSYGVVVNLPRWDFSKMIGVYVAMFFLAAQVIGYFGFGEIPTVSRMAGAALILSGAVVIALGA